MIKLLKSNSLISSLLTGFIFVQVVGVGLFSLIDAIFNNGKPILLNWTLNRFWSDRTGESEGLLIYIPILLIFYAFIGVTIKFIYSWHTKTFIRRK
tara:strand:- start:78 stop:365 length:288 start_codon:yes stop_codon:yes gene_type:complete